MELSKIYYFQPRGQCAVLLLRALLDLGNSGSKRDVLRHISENHWFTIQDEDREPYPSNKLTGGEPRWQTLIAWARKDFVLRDLVGDEARDLWSLTRNGRTVIDRIPENFRKGEFDVRLCFLWSPIFKSLMDPGYKQTDQDARRPYHFYRDLKSFDFLV